MKKTIKKLIPNFIKKRIKTYLKKNASVINEIVSYEIKIVDKKRLANNVAVVTGGSGAIGRSICSRLAAEGAIVYVCGMSENKINNVVEGIRQFEGTAYACRLNVTDESHIENTFSDIVKKHGRVDILVNCAGGSARNQIANIHEQEIPVIDSILDINLRGAILCCRQAAKQMVLQKRGNIINISSIIGEKGKARFAEYAASKAGIIAFTKSIAMELGKHGIRANCVSPGIVQRGSIDQDIIQKLRKTNYLADYGRPEDISNAVAFLVSNEASFITGQNLMVDGGRSLGLKEG